MKKLPLYQIDAFTDRLFSGNPAAVCMLDEWLPDLLMQQIAAENNLAETAFVVPVEEGFSIRWFTPAVEVDLCGHATLASAYVLFNILNFQGDEIRFFSPRSGLLKVSREKEMLFLDFPSDSLSEHPDMIPTVETCLGTRPLEIFRGKTDLVAVFEKEQDIRDIIPDLGSIARLEARGLIVTAPGDRVDFVSRFFAPQSGINEDPVTGSAHTSLAPLWHGKLGKTNMKAQQLSARGGSLSCEYRQDRCLIGGKAKLYLTGEIHIEE